MGAAIRRHRAQPHVMLDEHVRRKCIELGESLAQRHAIYLDTRYWIHLRDTQLGLRTTSEYQDLLTELRSAVSAGRAFCPLSAATFIELLKQSDPVCRQATATLVDELSLGVSLCDEETRVATELAHLFHKHGHAGDLQPLAHLVWVRLPYVLGVQHRMPEHLDAEEQVALAKTFFDHLWSRGMTDIVNVIGPGPLPDDFEGIAVRLNHGNVAHAQDLRSFKVTYLNEVKGALDLLADTGADILEWMFERSSGQGADSTVESRREAKQHVFALLAAIAESGKAAEAFPTLHALAKCHAAVRWNKGQRLDGNTLLDFHQAVAAVVYCDAFCTDGPLRVILTQKHVALDREFRCTVISDMSEAVEHLRLLKIGASGAARDVAAP
jgi:hypothetical protein